MVVTEQVKNLFHPDGSVQEITPPARAPREGCDAPVLFLLSSGIETKEIAYSGERAPFTTDKTEPITAADVLAGRATVEELGDRLKMVFVQRSKGYLNRKTLSVREIGELAAFVHQLRPDVFVVVDNCYGEFVEELEPTQVGADLIVGSLIKNPGGGLAPTGGYVAGRRDLVEGAAMRLSAPGIGGECGCTLGQNRLLYQGLFLAPHTVAQAVKTAVFAAKVMELLGYETEPHSSTIRRDIIQMIHMREPEALKKFCKGIQFGAPVDSYVTPEPWDMPGYDHPVIMAAGAFVQGASIELSADAPMREPYTVYLQGGLTFESGKLGVLLAVQELLGE
jgi:cystathionine beta-lyase family protein involved in aluminum resistance